jgi:hypothetical protein
MTLLNRLRSSSRAGWTVAGGGDWDDARAARDAPCDLIEVVLTNSPEQREDFMQAPKKKCLRRSTRGCELPDDGLPRTFPPSVISWRTGMEVA